MMTTNPKALALTRRSLVTAAAGFAGLAVTTSPGSSTSATVQDEPATPASPSGEVVTGGAPPILVDMLAGLPANLAPAATQPAVVCFYADLAMQFAVTGVGRTFPDEEQVDPGPFQQAIGPMAIASPAFQQVASRDVTEALGFRADQVDQALLLGTSPEAVNVFRGGIDTDAIPVAWEAAGYRPAGKGAGQFWTLGDELDPDSIINSRLATSFNSAAVRPNGDVVFTQTMRVMRSILAFEEGERAVGLEPGIGAALDAAPANLASAIITTPAFLDPDAGRKGQSGQRPVDRQQGARGGAAGSPVTSFLIGITPGFMNAQADVRADGDSSATPAVAAEAVIPPDGVIAVRLATTDEEQAATTVQGVVELWPTSTSLATDEPLTGYLEISGSGVVGAVAGIDFVPVRQPSIWIDIVLRQDIGPFRPATG